MPNVLLITSDQHNPTVGGFAGDPLVQTPVLDALASDGTMFRAAYTNNPICMPARSSLATGRFSSAIDSYDNGAPYAGEMAPSIGHRLRDAGRSAVTFGKLHFDPESDHGFDAYLPLMAKRGYVGALLGWQRGDAPPNQIMAAHARDAAPGVSEYELYDRHTTTAACRWLVDTAPQDSSWMAHVSYAHPHYPYRAPQTAPEAIDVPLPPAWAPHEWPRSADFDARRALMGYDEVPLTEDELRNLRWVYSGMVQFVDEQVGEVLDALERSGQAENTIVIYTSDHGDMLGGHGFLMKSHMYDASARVPMVIRGPGVTADHVCSTAVSLVDVFPTVLECTGIGAFDDDADLPGGSLVEVAGSSDDDQRSVFSEYHGPGSAAASYMVRQGRWKYVLSMRDDTAPQLFDMVADPDELVDHGANSEHEETLLALDGELRRFVDPERVDRDIRDAQQCALAEAGGPPNRTRPPGPMPRTPLGTLAQGWTVPSDEIMAAVSPTERA